VLDKAAILPGCRGQRQKQPEQDQDNKETAHKISFSVQEERFRGAINNRLDGPSGHLPDWLVSSSYCSNIPSEKKTLS
jgi:hypothetical protein